MTIPTPWPADDQGGTLGDGLPATATHHPGSVAEVQEVVRTAGAAELAVYPQGGGTALDHGGVPRRPGVALRLGRLDRVVDYPAADMTITVEAGMTLATIRDLVAGQGQRLAIEAGSPDRATLGGIFATASTGPRRFGWGRPRDQIIGVAYVSGAGDLIRGGGRVVKNVAGYDLPKLLTGSLGTLGIITELTLKVNPQPEAAAQVAVAFESLIQASAALDLLNLSRTRPVALELVQCEAPGAEPGAPWTLLIGLEGNGAAVAWQLDRLATELQRRDLPTLRDATAEARWREFVEQEADFAGTLSFAASFAPSQALRWLEQVPFDRWSVRVHAGNGVVRGFARTEADRESSVAEVVRLQTLAEQFGGALIVRRCPTAWKTRLGVWGDGRPDWRIAERIKLALDPGQILNPGRFVGTI